MATGTGAHHGSGGDGQGGGIHIQDGGNCSTCKQLDADCGPVTDPKCGGIIDCGSCPSGKTCGGGGDHNKCGVGNPDGCAPLTCADQNINCGQAGDGCGNTVMCGSCNLPQSCGGDPAKPGQCGCQGLCAQIPDCTEAGSTTTLTGKVLDPAGVHPLANALVYIPNDPTDPGLQPFAAGISCDVCGATAAGNPLVTDQTKPDGTFTLTNVPVGGTVPLVVQLGRWRRQFTVAINNSCAPNAVPANTLTMPKTHMEGDIPRIAVLTGGLDPVECVLRKMGVADSEFTNPGGAGHINFYKANQSDPHNNGVQGFGAIINAQTPDQPSLFAVNGGVPVINQYDMVILECEGYPQSESAADLNSLRTYAESGGRLFSSDFAYAWLSTNGNFAQAASWSPHGGGGSVGPVTIDLVSNPEGNVFDRWLEIVGVSAVGSDVIGSINPAFHNTSGVVAPTQQWLYNGSNAWPIHFAYNTPVGAQSDQQCGRVVFSDWHAVPFTGVTNNNVAFPGECRTTGFSNQESILEYMLFDLSACVQPYMPICTPITCAAQSIECGPAGDGCGNLLDCGPCQAPETCGGGGPGKCGTSTSCTPLSCSDQGLQCGQAGDGCGNVLNCGNCPTGDICGAAGPGKCGHPH